MYYYYGGIIYLALRKYDRAFFFFKTAISTPGSVMSQIIVESYKKYTLVSLLLHGQVCPFSKHVTLFLNRSLGSLVTPYDKLADAYATNSIFKLNDVVEDNEQEYIRDANMGMVKQVVESLLKVNMQRLTKTFLTLPLADMATKVNVSSVYEAKKHILKMVVIKMNC